MGQQEDNNQEKQNNQEEENQENQKKKSRFKLPIDISADSLLKELLRFVVVIFFIFLIIYFLEGRNQEKFSLEEIRNIDNKDLENISLVQNTKEWVSEEMLINTADEFANHFVRAVLVINYEAQNPELEAAVLNRKNLIQAEIRKAISARKYLELKNINNQNILTEEIRTIVLRLVRLPGIENVFFKEFTIH